MYYMYWYVCADGVYGNVVSYCGRDEFNSGVWSIMSLLVEGKSNVPLVIASALQLFAGWFSYT